AAKCSGAPAPGGRNKGKGDGAAEATALAAKTPAAAKAAIPVKRIAKPPLFVRAAGTRAACCGALSAAVSPAIPRRPLSNRIVSAHSLDGNCPHREGTVARYFMGTVEKPEGDTFMGLPHLLSFSLRK
ncbi:hypothetical protein, partial [Adlercreutzia equolifaciens]|uniref:hypothetical protein n=1 Tax=Adlercreutzia equolifaciens TaxID=446660 RepID=UPI0015F31AB8